VWLVVVAFVLRRHRDLSARVEAEEAAESRAQAAGA
jgi:hypothetical protein